MNIQKNRRRAVLHESNGSRREVCFFLRQFAETHSGRELAIDLFNSKAGFVTCEDVGQGDFFFVNKSRLLYVEPEERDLLEETLLFPRIAVEVEMIDGEVLQGEFCIELPPERSRLSDFLNFTPQFLYLVREGGRDAILNKFHVLAVKEKRE
ncbi:MAG: hypothetical protein JW821_01080 [Deltaproteobacteria bacterium]|nr:hypothetical protein [Deltaproteobacteria bacterium]